MKKQIQIGFIFLIFTLLSNVSFGAAYDEKELIARFDRIVTVEGKVSVSALRTIQNLIKDFKFDGAPEELTIETSWTTRSLVLNMGSFTVPSDRTFDFDYEQGTLTTKYNYINKLGSSTEMTFTFITNAIKRLHNSVSPIQKQSDGESSSSEKSESEDLSDLNLDKFFSISEDDFLKIPEMISTPELSSDSEGEERQYFGVNKFVKTTFKKLNTIRNIGMHIRTAKEEYDHLWTTASAGSASLGYVVDAVCNSNIFSAVYAVGYGVIALKSGKRSYDAFYNQCSTDALDLLKNIDESRKQIEAFSTSTVEMMNVVSTVLDVAQNDASKLAIEQAKISALIQNGLAEQKKDLESVLDLYEAAKTHSEDASQHFAKYKKKSEGITQAWAKINELFSELKSIAETSNQLVNKQKNPKQFFEERMEELLNIIAKIQMELSSIHEPMQEQNILALTISSHKQMHDNVLEEASKVLTSLIEKSQRKVEELTSKLAQSEEDSKKLSSSLEALKKELDECKRNQEEIIQASQRLKKNAEELKAQVERMYRKQDILIGVAIGLGLSMICPLGAVGIACAGLSGMEMSHFCHHNEGLLKSIIDTRKFNFTNMF